MAPTVSDGYWGRPTSTLDWCERNYEVSPYIAEFWNTISNIAIFLPPFIGIFQICKLNLERKYVFAFLAVAVVGFGSWAFHMTLLYPMQLADEFPMVWSTSVMTYLQFSIHRSPKSAINWSLMSICFLYSFAYSLFYLTFTNPLVHQVTYAIGLYFLLIKSLLFTRNSVQCKTCSRIVYSVWILLHVAFFLWNIDNHFCPQLENIRNELPKTLRPGTQLHAVWHILTGTAAYIHVLFLLHARGHFFKPKVNVIFTRFGFILSKDHKH